MHGDFPVIKSWDALQSHFLTNSPDYLLGVGGGLVRMNLAHKITELGGHICSIISNQALIGEFGNNIGEGVCILSQTTITCDVQIGVGTLINKAVIISHDATVGRYCDISPGVKLLGRIKIGDCTEVGTNAVLLPDVIVGSNCKVGAGAVVTKNIPDNTTVVGIPAKPLSR